MNAVFLTTSLKIFLVPPLAVSAQQVESGIPWWFWLLMGITLVILVWMLFNRPHEEEHQEGHGGAAVPAIQPDNSDVDFGPYSTEPETKTPPESLPTSPFLDAIEDEAPAVQTNETDYFKADDLTLIEGIGPKISKILNQADIHTYKQLAEKDSEGLLVVLAGAGIFMTDPSSWPEQAELASTNRWDELKKLQDTLKGGRAAG